MRTELSAQVLTDLFNVGPQRLSGASVVPLEPVPWRLRAEPWDPGVPPAEAPRCCSCGSSATWWPPWLSPFLSCPACLGEMALQTEHLQRWRGFQAHLHLFLAVGLGVSYFSCLRHGFSSGE